MKQSASILLLISLISLGNLNAQTGIRFGLKAGYSLATQYGISPADDSYTVDTDNRNGFAGGVFLYIPITESVGIQQEWLYAMKGSRQDVTINAASLNTVSQYNLNYFEMPLVLKYRFFKIKNFGIYGTTGIALSLLLDGDYNITTTINTGGTPIVLPVESGNMDGLDTFDYSFVYGLGSDFKLLNMDFFFDIRMTVGWNTLAMPNATNAEPVPLRNQDYVFALGMYF